MGLVGEGCNHETVEEGEELGCVGAVLTGGHLVQTWGDRSAYGLVSS